MKDAFRAYVSDAQEIQVYLSNDLTSKGIASIAPIAGKVTDDGETLKYAIKSLEMAIEKARTEMFQSGR